jgi:hypothetical protein
MTAGDYTALEARVAELEHQMRNILPAKVDSISYGLGVLHHEVTEQFGDVRERLGRIELTQERQGDRLGRIELTQERQSDQLAEILRRLTGGASNGPSTGQNDH